MSDEGGQVVDVEHGNGHGHADGVHYDPEANKMGMWLFLITEVILFGMLFLSYLVFLHEYTQGFIEGSHELNVPIGAVNTVILLFSSLTMALSIAALQRKNVKLCVNLLFVTILCALAFLVIKGFEWQAKFHHGIYPGSPEFENFTKGKILFFGHYFMMAGIHALHVLIGVFVIAYAIRQVQKGKIHAERIDFLENTGLYWHLVDVVWIYLFPLLYLIG